MITGTTLVLHNTLDITISIDKKAFNTDKHLARAAHKYTCEQNHIRTVLVIPNIRVYPDTT